MGKNPSSTKLTLGIAAFLLCRSSFGVEEIAPIPLTSFNGTNGTAPYAGLTSNGNEEFYGTTSIGGINNKGTVFKVGTNGTITTLVHFNGTNGSLPYAQLIRGGNGRLYGTTYMGSTNYAPVSYAG